MHKELQQNFNFEIKSSNGSWTEVENSNYSMQAC